ncbi:MAG: sigma-70 family RNA polymerase sigma factor [Lysobacter sp.]|nr:sigma-70 family RNA polymerase sigma factor [Lysobacter sp.]
MLQTAGLPHEARAPQGAAAEDVRLMARVALEDVRAFELVYRRYSPRLARFLRGMLRQQALVDEVLDDTMLVAWRKAHTWDAASQLSTWLFAIAYRQALKAVRRDVTAQALDEEPAAPASAEPDGELEHYQLRLRLAGALGALTPEHRAVVELTYYQGYSCREIADIVGCPVATVKTRMFYARQRLRGLVAREDVS